jgi:Calcineurin-like phosphoesterase
MSTNRRRFLVGAGLAGFGLAGAGKLLFADRSSSADEDGDTASLTAGAAFRNDLPLAAVATPKSKLLLRFAAIADTGSSTKNQYAVGRAMTRYHAQNPFNTVIMVGDNIYTNGEISKIKEAFEIPYADLLKQGVKFYAALGNHDVRTALLCPRTCGGKILCAGNEFHRRSDIDRKSHPISLARSRIGRQ